eukprot:3211509-Pleurochrysis_carterae.AAC.1
MLNEEGRLPSTRDERVACVAGERLCRLAREPQSRSRLRGAAAGLVAAAALSADPWTRLLPCLFLVAVPNGLAAFSGQSVSGASRFVAAC